MYHIAGKFCGVNFLRMVNLKKISRSKFRGLNFAHLRDQKHPHGRTLCKRRLFAVAIMKNRKDPIVGLDFNYCSFARLPGL